MGHSRLAVSLMPGSDKYRHIDRDDLLAGVWEEQDSYPVLENVFRDSLNFSDFHDAPIRWLGIGCPGLLGLCGGVVCPQA